MTPPTTYIDVLRDLSNEYVRVLMVGHNPGLEQLVNMLSGEEHAMPTCSLVHVQLRINSWTEIDYKEYGTPTIESNLLKNTIYYILSPNLGPS